MLSARVKLKDFWCRQPFARMLSATMAGEGSCRRRVVSLPLQHPWNEWRIVWSFSLTLSLEFSLSRRLQHLPHVLHSRSDATMGNLFAKFSLSAADVLLQYDILVREGAKYFRHSMHLLCDAAEENVKWTSFETFSSWFERNESFFQLCTLHSSFLLPSICKRWRKMKDSLFCVFSWDGGRAHTRWSRIEQNSELSESCCFLGAEKAEAISRMGKLGYRTQLIVARWTSFVFREHAQWSENAHTRANEGKTMRVQFDSVADDERNFEFQSALAGVSEGGKVLFLLCFRASIVNQTFTPS